MQYCIDLDAVSRAQVANLHMFFSPELQDLLEHPILVTPAIQNEPTVAKIIDAIRAFIWGRRNLMVNSYIFKTSQQEGHTFKEFYVALNNLAWDVNICLQCSNTQLVHWITAGMRDPALHKKLLRMHPMPHFSKNWTRKTGLNSEIDFGPREHRPHIVFLAVRNEIFKQRDSFVCVK
jgi:hypothetical protein